MAMTNKIIISLTFFIAIHLQVKGQEFVDLGLPSGIKWATCNIGSNKPEQVGEYFAWGETQSKRKYKIGNYKYYKNNIFYPGHMGDKLERTSVTKYSIVYNSNELYINSAYDDKKELDLIDDVAYKKNGYGWRIPSIQDFQELFDNSDCEFTIIDGNKCLKLSSTVKGYEDKYIVLHISGMVSDQTYKNHKKESMKSGKEIENDIFYWTSSLSQDSNSKHAVALYVNRTLSDNYISVFRFIGMPIRPIFDKTSDKIF